MHTTQELINSLKKDKENLNTMLNSMGVETTGSETFTKLVPLVGKIVTDPILQDKSIEITENGTTNITADEGYDGLYNVSVTTNVASGGGDLPSVGFVVDEWDENGYPITVSTIGMTKIPDYYFEENTRNIFSKAKTVNFNDGLEEIGNGCFLKSNIENVDVSKIKVFGDSAFSSCKSLTHIDLPKDLENIPNQLFYECDGLTKMMIPESVKTIGNYSFYGCGNLKQVSMGDVTSISGGSSNGSFRSCTGLKAVWIGAGLNNNTFLRYIFYGCKAITHMYINLPRATVEAMTNYSYAFSNNAVTTDVIICNDDADWITREEFDATTW